MKVNKPKTSVPYWDEGQRGSTYFHWYKKGWWKRQLRKKWIRNMLKNFEKE